MATSPVLSALRRKYAERLGAYDHAALAHLAPVILMFSPDEDIAAIKPIRHHADHSGGKRQLWLGLALDILRTANGPMSVGEVAQRIAADRQITGLGARESIKSALNNAFKRREGDVLVAVGNGPRRWSVMTD